MSKTIEIKDIAETEDARELADSELELVTGGIYNTAPNTSRDSSASGETDDH
ncbi:hypothetical protein SAMN02745121_01417 [Nannocystis exedens]|uniref:Uncharacterized protein n=1 Tax=Nannocystis exedens TaxID=54 RepID=A0A1I1UZ43_9BACT|nr:hypothetical protein [Nannocystis exedens]PCC72208.1 hypothetical protein NAEX_05287 [Nannocystis exedens]SFD75954.1 hypothetical protein SAMN02745121_01417 [Nannocystis exedens]